MELTRVERGQVKAHIGDMLNGQPDAELENLARGRWRGSMSLQDGIWGLCKECRRTMLCKRFPLICLKNCNPSFDITDLTAESLGSNRLPKSSRNNDRMPYDPTIYRGSAAYYTWGRPPYSRSLACTLATEVDLDGLGRLLDIGCGPGTITIALADHFEEAIGLDPDADMLAAAVDRAIGVNNVRWVQALAEDIRGLDLGKFRLVTFGQSFHWTERERVAESDSPF